MKRSTRRKASIACSVIVLVLVVLGVFSNGISNGFVWDDEAQVLNNPWIKDIRYLGKMFSSDVFGYYQSVATTNYYRPVAHVFYTATWHVFGADAPAFHLVNIALHVSVTLLVFLLVSRLLNRPLVGEADKNEGRERIGDSESKALVGALAAALLFGVHPVHAQAVDWISGIMELAFTFFGLLSFHLFLDFETRKRKAFLSLSVILFALAMFSKETAIVLLPLFVVYEVSCGAANALSRASCGKYAAYLAVTALYLLVRTKALHTLVPVDLHPDLSTYECVINGFPLFFDYLRALVWPVELNVFQVFHPVRSLLEPRALLGLFVVCCYLAGSYWWWRRDRLVFFALALILLPLLPLFYIRAIAPLVVAEQHLYLPSLGLALLVARIAVWAASQDAKIRYGLGVVFLAAICFFSVVTAQRNLVWKDNLSLWSHAVEKSPESSFVHESLGGALLNRGRVDEAIEQYRLVLEADPSPSARTYNNVGIAYSRKGWTDEAIEAFSRALTIRPDYARAHVGLGIAYYEKGWTDGAIQEFQSAIELDPYLVDAYHNLGVAYASKGNHAEAEKAMKEAARLNPGYHKKKD